MNYTFPKLLVWVDEALSPSALMNQELSPEDFKNWTAYSVNKSAKWKINISSYMFSQAATEDKKQFLKAQQQQLVSLINQVNQYLFKRKRIWYISPQAGMIKKLYVSVLNIFEDLLSYAEKYFSEFCDMTIKISDFRLKKILPELRKETNDLQLLLQNANIDGELVGLIIKGINAISIPGKLSYASLKYVMNMISQVKSLNSLNQHTLIKTLISLDFNRPEFYLYLTNITNLKLQNIDGLHEQLEYIIQQSNEMNGVLIQNQCSFNSNDCSLKLELQNFFEAKAAYLEKLLNHRRLAMQDKIDAEKALRLLLDMTVPQFALFIRVLKETQIILKTGITEVCTFFAMHFYTDKSLFISSSNLLKRSTDVEFATVLKLWDMLIDMQNWLDEKFSIRNYRRSL